MCAAHRPAGSGRPPASSHRRATARLTSLAESMHAHRFGSGPCHYLARSPAVRCSALAFIRMAARVSHGMPCAHDQESIPTTGSGFARTASLRAGARSHKPHERPSVHMHAAVQRVIGAVATLTPADPSLDSRSVVACMSSAQGEHRVVLIRSYVHGQ